jgi:hypothetical protein
VKKLAILLVVVAAVSCRQQVVVPPSQVDTRAGAPTPRGALTRFMTAAKNQDLQEMSNIWGSSAGPARSTMDQQTLEQREFILMGCLKHDSYRVLSEAPAMVNERMLSVELKHKDLTRSSNFYVTRGPEDRWYVRTLDLEPLRDICVRKT